jgi:phage gp29-like protein
MALLDQFGNPIEISKLRDEECAPTMSGVRPVISSHPSRGLTPQRLAAILVEAEEGDATLYFELAEDMEEKDLHYLGVMGTRKRAVAQLEITVEAASDNAADVAIADEVRDFLRRDVLQMELFDILDAIGKGVSCSEIIWDMSGKQWMPKQIKRREPRYFAFSRQDGETLMRREFGQYIPLTPFKYIVHTAKAKSGFAIRGGLARAVSWIWLFKNFSLKDWVAFGEVFGQPYRVGKYHPSATKEDKAALLRAVASIGSDAAAIIPEGMMIEFIEAAKSGSIDVYDRISRFLDEQISKGVLGQTTTTEVTQGGGSRALGQVHDEVRQDIRDYDAVQLAATLNRDLVRPYVDLNHGPQKKYPTLILGRPDELTLPQKLDYTAKFVAQGMRVEASQVRDRLGWSEPEAGTEVLVQPAAAAPTLALQSRRKMSSALLRAIHAAGQTGDVVDEAVDSAIGDSDWQPVMEPVIDPIKRIFDSAETLDDVRAQLADLAHAMGLDELTADLGDAMFVARLAGALGIDLAQEQPAGV